MIGLALLGGLAWTFTGDALESLAITLIFNGVRVILYIGHEELWERWPPLASVGRPSAGPSAPRAGESILID